MLEQHEINVLLVMTRNAIESTEYIIGVYDKQNKEPHPKMKTKQDLNIDLEVLKNILNKLSD